MNNDLVDLSCGVERQKVKILGGMKEMNIEL